jgi:tetrapyrrole methylase family protein/MazG family protein
VQKKAAKAGFDWPDVGGALPKVAEETAEVLQAVREGDDEAVVAEVGDLLFAVVNVARHLRVEPESALRIATRTFRRRFEIVERLAGERGIDLTAAELATLLALWDEAKVASIATE